MSGAGRKGDFQPTTQRPPAPPPHTHKHPSLTRPPPPACAPGSVGRWLGGGWAPPTCAAPLAWAAGTGGPGLEGGVGGWKGRRSRVLVRVGGGLCSPAPHRLTPRLGLLRSCPLPSPTHLHALPMHTPLRHYSPLVLLPSTHRHPHAPPTHNTHPGTAHPWCLKAPPPSALQSRRSQPTNRPPAPLPQL